MLRSTAVLLTRLITGVNPVWVDCSPESECLRVYFANHGSHLDFATLWAALPRAARERTRPVAARDYWGRTPFSRSGGRGCSTDCSLPARASPGGTIRFEQMAAAMHEGHSLILFPGRHAQLPTADGRVQAGALSSGEKVPEAELVPVYLQNLNRILPKGHLLPMPLISSVVFGPPIRLEPGETKRDFLPRRACGPEPRTARLTQ